MPFETPETPPFSHQVPAKKIAVIGGGISGMGAAYYLSAARHRVSLFENAPRLGGHARTVVAGKRGDQPVDTGFIVFNHVNYPNLCALFDQLDVPTVKSDMSFAASIDGGRLEYSLASLRQVFAQPKNIISPRFLRMVRDILRFNSEALAMSEGSDETIGQLLDRMGVGEYFAKYYLAPMSGAIWSTPTDQVMEFPARTLIQFFRNHGLLSVNGQHQWYTVEGGSISYVSRLEAAMQRNGVDIHLNAGVEAVRRDAAGAWVRRAGGEWERFDDVVLATHSDDSLALLTDAAPEEAEALGAVRYQPNEAVLHADPVVMPRLRKTWSSWNYTEDRAQQSDKIDLTYWMNSLQPIPQDDPMFVTLNSRRTIREELIYDQVTFRHPVYDLGAIAAQKQVKAFYGARNTWFCGAWMRHGFHEDGLSSALDVVSGIARRSSMHLAAE